MKSMITSLSSACFALAQDANLGPEESHGPKPLAAYKPPEAHTGLPSAVTLISCVESTSPTRTGVRKSLPFCKGPSPLWDSHTDSHGAREKAT